jgi:hypothetical protein
MDTRQEVIVPPWNRDEGKLIQIVWEGRTIGFMRILPQDSEPSHAAIVPRKERHIIALMEQMRRALQKVEVAFQHSGEKAAEKKLAPYRAIRAELDELCKAAGYPGYDEWYEKYTGYNPARDPWNSKLN